MEQNKELLNNNEKFNLRKCLYLSETLTNFIRQIEENNTVEKDSDFYSVLYETIFSMLLPSLFEDKEYDNEEEYKNEFVPYLNDLIDRINESEDFDITIYTKFALEDDEEENIDV